MHGAKNCATAAGIRCVCGRELTETKKKECVRKGERNHVLSLPAVGRFPMRGCVCVSERAIRGVEQSLLASPPPERERHEQRHETLAR